MRPQRARSRDRACWCCSPPRRRLRGVGLTSPSAAARRRSSVRRLPRGVWRPRLLRPPPTRRTCAENPYKPGNQLYKTVVQPPAQPSWPLPHIMRGAGSGGRTRILTVRASRPPKRASPCHAMGSSPASRAGAPTRQCSLGAKAQSYPSPKAIDRRELEFFYNALSLSSYP